MTDHAPLLASLVGSLTAGGGLRSPAWRRVAEAVARHEFLRGGFFRPVDGAVPTAWEPVLEGDPGWLEACYADESLVTQIAGTVVPADVRGRILREPTSSSTLPSLVLRMLEDLHVEPGMRVLEIGTGTGYSTALLARRLGEENVTSVEYDADVAVRARTALGRLGIHPALVTGDGLHGYAANAPYDRVVATCAVRAVPRAWIEQTRPGGLVLATLGGWLGASELARLTVHEDGTASGTLLGGHVSFMLARPHLPPPLGLLPDLGAGTERRAVFGADALDDRTARFVVQAAAPDAQRLTLARDGWQEDVLLDVVSGSWAALRRDGGSWTVRQGGPHALWDAAEEQLSRWHAAGAPGPERFTCHITPQGPTWGW
ncbi:ATP-grasp peptide maturase system methyltransferase [Streptomyces sp. NPDC058733]|uniref:ATP-grasp peptide maturase system methyltransferase n=1 Tax=Streptomyces sp. NPDC058733 TaxID=3346614 RepID=UPI0036B7F7DB